MGLLRTILFLVVAWFVFKFLDAWWARRKSSPKHSSNSTRPSRGKPSQQEIIIDYDPRMTRSHTRDDAGEVVEFEEIEDDSKS